MSGSVRSSAECSTSGSLYSSFSDESGTGLDLLVVPGLSENVGVGEAESSVQSSQGEVTLASLLGVVPLSLSTNIIDDKIAGEPSGILLHSPRSIMNAVDLERIEDLYGIPRSEVRLPRPYERADWSIPGYHCFYEINLRNGLRFPLPTLSRAVLNHWGIAPSQLMPNSWRILLSLEVLGWLHEVQFGLVEFLHSYYLREHEGEKGRYMIHNRANRDAIITNLTTNVRGWKDRYLFIKSTFLGEGSFVSSQWFVPDRARNIQSIVGLNLKERTSALLSRPEGERSWSYLLLDHLLKFTPLWNTLKPEKEQEMREKARMINLDDDVLARKRAKMLEAAAKKKKKGKSVEQNEFEPLVALPSMENVESQKVVKRKRKSTSEEPRYDNSHEYVSLNFPIDSSLLSAPKSVLIEGKKILLPEDEKRLVSLGHQKSSERTLVQSLLAVQGIIYMERELLALSEKNEELVSVNVDLNKENERLKEELAHSSRQRKREESKLVSLEKENAEMKNGLSEASEQVSALKLQVADLEDAKETTELDVSTAMEYKLMKEFLVHRGESWDPQKIINDYEELQALQRDLEAEGDNEDEEKEGDEKEEDEKEEDDAENTPKD